jgi:hypothetical protein
MTCAWVPPYRTCLLQVIVTGVSAGGRDEGGALVFFDKTKLELVRKVSPPWPLAYKGDGGMEDTA